MKVGFRKPSLKRSLKARTTGRLKRSLKRSVNPLYGKKGMGYLKNPSRALKNKVYHKTTFGLSDIAKSGSKSSGHRGQTVAVPAQQAEYASGKSKKTTMILCALCFIGIGGIHDFYLGNVGNGIIKFATANWFFIGGIIDLVKISNGEYLDRTGLPIIND